MRIKKGWLMARDELTRKMIPFFLKVRSEDIVPTSPVKISEALRHTSLKWTETMVSDSTDVTVYKFSRNYSGFVNDLDIHGEMSTAAIENGVLYYYLYKDGRARIEGEVQISNQRRDGQPSDSDALLLRKKVIDLPYGIKKTFLDSDDWTDSYKVDGDAYTNGPKNPIKIRRADGLNVSYLGAYVSSADITATELGNGKDLFRLNIVDYFNQEIEYGMSDYTAEYLQNYVVDMGIVSKDKLSKLTAKDLYNATRYSISHEFYWK